jgi:hypothetical protein
MKNVNVKTRRIQRKRIDDLLPIAAQVREESSRVPERDRAQLQGEV